MMKLSLFEFNEWWIQWFQCIWIDGRVTISYIFGETLHVWVDGKVEWEEGHLSGVLFSSMSVSSWEEHDWDPLLAYEKPWGQQKHVTISSERWSGNFGKRDHNRHYRNIASIISSTWVFSCLCLNSCCGHLGSLQTNYLLNICDKW